MLEMVLQHCPRCCWTFTRSYQVELQQTNYHFYRRESLLGSLIKVCLLLGVCIFLYNLWSVDQASQPSRQKMLDLEFPHHPVQDHLSTSAISLLVAVSPSSPKPKLWSRPFPSRTSPFSLVEALSSSPKLVEELCLPSSLKRHLSEVPSSLKAKMSRQNVLEVSRISTTIINTLVIT